MWFSSSLHYWGLVCPKDNAPGVWLLVQMQICKPKPCWGNGLITRLRSVEATAHCWGLPSWAVLTHTWKLPKPLLLSKCISQQYISIVSFYLYTSERMSGCQLFKEMSFLLFFNYFFVSNMHKLSKIIIIRRSKWGCGQDTKEPLMPSLLNWLLIDHGAVSKQTLPWVLGLAGLEM